MPEPMRGLVAIAEYGSKIEVDLAVGALADVGITATASFDPAMNTAAPFMASDRTFELLVRDGDAEAAVARLHEVVDGLPEEFAEPERRVPSRRRNRLRRIVLVLIVLVFVAPLLALAAAMLVNGSDSSLSVDDAPPPPTTLFSPVVPSTSVGAPPASIEVAGLPEGLPLADLAWRERAQPEVAAIGAERPRRIGIVRFTAPATFVFPVVGLTPSEESLIESRAPAGGTFDAVDADVARADLEEIQVRLQAEIGPVTSTIDLDVPVLQVVTAEVDPALEQQALAIASAYLASTDLPVGASTDPSDYVEVVEGSFSL